MQRGTETGRGRGKGGVEELSGDKSKRLCPADRAKINTFHVIFVRDLKLNLLLWWFGSILTSPRCMFKMGAIFEWSLGLIFCITHTQEEVFPCDVTKLIVHRWCSVDWMWVLGEVCVMLEKATWDS